MNTDKILASPFAPGDLFGFVTGTYTVMGQRDDETRGAIVALLVQPRSMIRGTALFVADYQEAMRLERWVEMLTMGLDCGTLERVHRAGEKLL